MARRVLFWLLIGFTINLIVSLALVTVMPWLWFRSEIGPARSWWVSSPPDVPAPRVQQVRSAFGNTTFIVHGWYDRDEAEVEAIIERSRAAHYLTEVPNHVASGQRVGWPMRSFAEHVATFGVMRRGEPDSWRDHVAMAWERGVPLDIGSTRADSIPIRPLWIGLIVNTGLYATGAYVLVRGPWWGRRWLRGRRGACVACGYALGDLDSCPECGRSATTASDTASSMTG